MLVGRPSCFDVWHSRPRLCEMPCTAEGGCATWDHRFTHQSMLDGALEHSATVHMLVGRRFACPTLRLPDIMSGIGRRDK